VTGRASFFCAEDACASWARRSASEFSHLRLSSSFVASMFWLTERQLPCRLLRAHVVSIDRWDASTESGKLAFEC